MYIFLLAPEPVIMTLAKAVLRMEEFVLDHPRTNPYNTESVQTTQKIESEEDAGDPGERVMSHKLKHAPSQQEQEKD